MVVAGGTLCQSKSGVAEELLERGRVVAFANVDTALGALNSTFWVTTLQKAACEPIFGALLFKPSSGQLPVLEGAQSRGDHALGFSAVTLFLLF